MKALSVTEIEKKADEITKDISESIEFLKENFGPETWADLNRIWGKFDKEISSKKTEIPDWTLDEMLAMKWYFCCYLCCCISY